LGGSCFEAALEKVSETSLTNVIGMGYLPINRAMHVVGSQSKACLGKEYKNLSEKQLQQKRDEGCGSSG
jgi:hypothetical protein